MKKAGTYILGGAVSALLLAVPAVAAKKAATVREAWQAETISGKIEMVEPAQRLVVIEGSDSVPFDLVVTPKTHIRIGNRTATLKELETCQDKNVSVHFVPERRGDVAESIEVTSQG